MIHPILIHGQWRPASGTESFCSQNPATGEALPEVYPVSQWPDLDAALDAAVAAVEQLRAVGSDRLAGFLNAYASRIEARAVELCKAANVETALPMTPRLQTIELPRTVTQLRQAAAAALEGSWSLPTIDTKNNIRSYFAAIGPVLVIGPNNFPLAFNAVSGGDFAAAIAAGNPVIAKAHPGHPTTTRLLAEEAFAALKESGLPMATVQLVYHMSPDTGLRLAADPRLGALAFTGSRRAGLSLKGAADQAGKPAYLEMSSLNPVVILPGALKERLEKLADEFADSALAANGQFCTNPGLTLLVASAEADSFINAVRQRFESRKPSALLSSGVCSGLQSSIKMLMGAGAKALTHNTSPESPNTNPNVLLLITGSQFLDDARTFQTEAFGNASLFVTAKDAGELSQILVALEGNLTGGIYSATTGEDDAMYQELAPALRAKVGRLLNDKMPTGVALSPAMNHGGPYPATGHPGFSAVGIPGSLRRFAVLQSFDNVRVSRLPGVLGNKNPTGKTWRLVDGNWTQGDVP